MNMAGNGMLAMNVRGEIRKLDMLHCVAANDREEELLLSIDASFMLDQKNSVERNDISATPSTYPSTCLAFLVSSWRVHLDLQTLMCLFFSFGFFF